MKGREVFSATALLLCTLALVRNSFRSPRGTCEGAYQGCTFELCAPASGNCPADGMNDGMPYHWANFTPVSIYLVRPHSRAGLFVERAEDLLFSDLLRYEGHER